MWQVTCRALTQVPPAPAACSLPAKCMARTDIKTIPLTGERKRLKVKRLDPELSAVINPRSPLNSVNCVCVCVCLRTFGMDWCEKLLCINYGLSPTSQNGELIFCFSFNATQQVSPLGPPLQPQRRRNLVCLFWSPDDQTMSGYWGKLQRAAWLWLTELTFTESTSSSSLQSSLDDALTAANISHAGSTTSLLMVSTVSSIDTMVMVGKVVTKLIHGSKNIFNNLLNKGGSSCVVTVRQQKRQKIGSALLP